jgi:hypothetical protein
MFEQREHERLLVDRPLGVVQSNGEVIYCRARDLSAGGVGFISRYGADIGSQFDVFFSLTTGDGTLARVEARIKVIYVHLGGGEHPFRIGGQFVTFNGRGREHLNEFINERLR